MKNYTAPVMEIKHFSSSENITSLNDWLLNAGSDYANAGISTYIVTSV